MEYRLPLAQLQYNVTQHPNKTWLHQPVDREWTTYTWGDVDNQARRIASALLANGLSQGDKVAIIAKNSAEWFISDAAIMMAGLISVPIYSTAGADTIKHVLNHSGAKAIFVGKLDDTAALEEAMAADLLSIAYPYPTLSCKVQWTDWLQEYEPIQELHEPEADDMFSLIYTSGSTGLPKGVVLSQCNVAASAKSAADLPGAAEDERVMSYLPLAHITERCVVELPSYYRPADIYFTESLSTFIDDVRYARPTNFISVPRLWTKFQSQILAQISNQKLQLLLKIPFIGKRVAHKIRAGLGLDKAVRFGSGSAPISPDVLRWFHTIGVNIGEGWGMTETSGLSCCNLPFQMEYLGTIGSPLSCVEMTLSEEGEVLIRGDAIFKEYYNNPEATADAFIKDWFKTGDRAELREDGSWKIIGRVKEQFKTGKGKYVAPVPIESSLGRNTDIEQVCVMGIGRKQPIALVVLGEGVSNDRSKVSQQLERTLEAVNGDLESHQVLDHIIVTEEPWSIENGLLTPTLKLKRDQLEQRYGHFLTAPLKGKVIWES
ncbi:AMP-binding protein [Pseudomaricurvus alkylphenolicus]|uniref:AMP-binding protein n=1 Tax=Pseudomaricurvus alkylphenolicus TaxID=1306991 RepID=UPI001423D25E|nr:AMP-binding protein [Pseudomaricurvus alkylphenolicus]NIB44146.1 AMP-binding protein [Pseudomaricurvus alkylphenolicus]